MEKKIASRSGRGIGESAKPHDALAGETVDPVVRSHAKWVFAMARRQLRNTAMAEDATQIVFLAFWRKCRKSSGTTGQAAEGWLARATQYACNNLRVIERRRVAHLRRVFSERAGRWELTCSDDELRLALDAAMQRISDADRNLLMARFYQGQDFRKIARRLGVTEGAAKMRISRAIERLRTAMEPRDSLAAVPLPAALLAFKKCEVAECQLIGLPHASRSWLNGAQSAARLMWKRSFWRICVPAAAVAGASFVAGGTAIPMMLGELQHRPTTVTAHTAVPDHDFPDKVAMAPKRAQGPGTATIRLLSSATAKSRSPAVLGHPLNSPDMTTTRSPARSAQWEPPSCPGVSGLPRDASTQRRQAPAKNPAGNGPPHLRPDGTGVLIARNPTPDREYVATGVSGGNAISR